MALAGNFRGFTLIELLIVVAIIAILAAVAVPNFIEAQTRARVSRVLAETRSLATAIEAYHIDAGHYPLPAGSGHGARLWRLSTPIAYITEPTRREPFKDSNPIDPDPPYGYNGRNEWTNISWKNDGDPAVFNGEVFVHWWLLRSSGPDNDRDGGATSALNHDSSRRHFIPFVYDPTNGTMSRGEIWRYGGQPTGRGSDSASLMNH